MQTRHLPRVRRMWLFTPVVALFFACAPAGEAPSSSASPEEVAAWEARAAGVEIIRDEWGIPHIYGETDADAIFGLMYAQAEDDFNRIEVNFLNSQGRLAEAEGESEIWRDLRMRLFIDPAEMMEMYDASPAWLRDLMDAWADGLNYYLHTHPEVEPRALDRFEPWMALTFSEGSIGGDIERVNLGELEAFYGDIETQMELVAQPAEATMGMATEEPPVVVASSLVEPDPDEEPRGSNGISVAPENTVDGNALLLINPHTSFFFRHEAHVVSEEGLNAYGALTWGQFFIYQGFNETAGWMHTSSSVDNIDEFLETVVQKDDGLYYVYGDEERPVESRTVTIEYRDGDGMSERQFTVYRTHHGPIVRSTDDRWVSVGLMEEPLNALTQSYIRTKAANLEEFVDVMDMHTNSSNNTLFADAEGNIAYLHSNFIPRRDPSFDYGRPVDGSNPATDWDGVLSFDESPNSVNPPNGWAQNTNNWPFSASGQYSPRQDDFPAYVDRGSENARGRHALGLLEGRTDLTLDGLVELAYSSYQPGFETVIPPLVAGFDGLPADDPLREQVGEAVEMLRNWDLRWSRESIENSLATYFGGEIRGAAGEAARAAGVSTAEYLASEAGGRTQVEVLASVMQELEGDFGDWRTPWGEINRFQRLTGDIRQPFNDDEPSTPVGFSSGRYGSLASFGARRYEGTKRMYGTSGNSFVAVVEFGDRVTARAVTAGGLSDDPNSPHFNDQAERYATGDLRPVHFYREDVVQNARETYRPGSRR